MFVLLRILSYMISISGCRLIRIVMRHHLGASTPPIGIHRNLELRYFWDISWSEKKKLGFLDYRFNLYKKKVWTGGRFDRFAYLATDRIRYVYQVIQCDLSIPKRWRSLNHLKGLLNHPKKVTTWITRFGRWGCQEVARKGLVHDETPLKTNGWRALKFDGGWKRWLLLKIWPIFGIYVRFPRCKLWYHYKPSFNLRLSITGSNFTSQNT